jgi:hypothetical protein
VTGLVDLQLTLVLLGVAWLNRRAASSLQRKIDDLDRLAASPD